MGVNRRAANRTVALTTATLALLLLGCSSGTKVATAAASSASSTAARTTTTRPATTTQPAPSSDPATRLVTAARAQVGVTVGYDPAYVRLAYPGGDVPIETGVCTDVVIRAFRKLDIDLQVNVHKDMRANFSKYPKNWGLKKPDTNIDHRRVPNLATYFTRRGYSLPVTSNPADYLPGDVVAIKLPLDHIGIVSDRKSAAGTPLLIHNVGNGAQEEDVLFAWKVVGHYRALN
jgi:uncharacterized protein